MITTSSILIQGLEIYAYHGSFGEERQLGQRFLLDLTLRVDIAASAASDTLADTVDYGAVVGVVTEAFTQKRFKLLEAAARAVAQAVLAAYPSVASLAVTLRKPSPPIAATLSAVGVSLEFTRDA